MLSRRTILLGILCVLFVPSISLSQAELSDAEIIREINASERRMLNHVDKKVEELGNNFNELDKNVAVANEGVTKEMEGMGKRIDDMGDRIGDLQGRINLILNLVIGGIISFFISLVLFVVGYITKPLWEEKLPWRRKEKVGPREEQVSEEIETREKYTDNTEPDYQVAEGGS